MSLEVQKKNHNSATHHGLIKLISMRGLAQSMPLVSWAVFSKEENSSKSLTPKIEPTTQGVEDNSDNFENHDDELQNLVDKNLGQSDNDIEIYGNENPSEEFESLQPEKSIRGSDDKKIKLGVHTRRAKDVVGVSTPSVLTPYNTRFKRKYEETTSGLQKLATVACTMTQNPEEIGVEILATNLLRGRDRKNREQR